MTDKIIVACPLTKEKMRELSNEFLKRKEGKEKEEYRDSIEFVKEDERFAIGGTDVDWIKNWENLDCGKEKSNIHKENEINWVEDESESWESLKIDMKHTLGNNKEYIETPNWIFLSHSNDTIKGKAQPIDNVQKNIPLIRLVLKKHKDKLTKEDIELQQFVFFDENIDRRSVGFQKAIFSLDLRMYRVIDADSKEYYIFSRQEIPNGVCEFHGMIVPIEDLADMGKNLKLKSISKVFILKDFIPAVKILTKEQIVTYTSERKISSDDWLNFLAYHPQGSYNLFPEEVEFIRSSWILSGKADNYPLHMFIMGKAGTKKSMGHAETIAYKFDEDFDILEGGNSRIKGLTPSFKEKPANLGYLANSNRIGIIDEIGKMIEFETNKHDSKVRNVLGECNFLFEHKQRLVGSGNDNNIRVQADAKFAMVSNPVSSMDNIQEHVGLIDPTTMSRTLVWVQDAEETKFLLSPESVYKSPPTPKSIEIGNNYIEKRKSTLYLYMCWGKITNRDEFLTLYDTCNSFVSEIDDLEIEKLTNMITMLAKEPMKSSVWKPRGLHHVKLVVDGLCKHRCLFEDYDSSFIANQIDYKRAEKILLRMVKGWDTSFRLNSNEWEGKFQ